jgi:hypothetical protein
VRDILVTLVIVVVGFIALWLVLPQPPICIGNCTRGDKHCQEMCFKKGECPYGWQP